MVENHGIEIRIIEQRDNIALARIIRDTLKEFDADKPNTVYYDDRTDRLFEEFRTPKSIYNVAEENGVVVGGAGIFPTDNLPSDTCELVKFYLLPSARGKGIGKLLLQECLSTAKMLGYKKVYLESMPELTIAIPMYEKFGFTYLDHSLGNSGHTSCDVWMIKEL
jgi:putative acetyltransferase